MRQLAPPPQAPSPLAQVPPTPADPTSPGRSDAPSHLPTGADAASNPKLIETQPQPENKMEADDTASPNPQPVPALASEEASPEDTPPAFSSSSPSAHAAAPPGAREVAVAMEAVERDAAAIAESYASLFASLRVALSNVTSTSAENIQCLGDVVGRLQESALEASSKGNKYINSCLRLNEEIRGLESLAMQLKILRKNVDSLDLAVDQLLHIP